MRRRHASRLADGSSKRPRTRASLLVAILLAAPLVAIPVTTVAAVEAPFDGTPISAGLGPTYGEPWCADAAPGSSIANQQGFSGPFPNSLALIPYEAIRCTLDQIIDEGADAGIPERLTYSVNTLTDTGREQLAVIVNALETPEQQRDYERWQQIRALMTSDPAGAQDLLASYGADVKIPIFIEANIHGGEEEGTDAMMQVFRDLVTTPYGEHPVVDSLLDHTILIVIPTQNPDGRFLGTRANSNGFDMNRDLLVQSQPEIRANVNLQLQWLAPVMLAMHGYVNPTLVDGLTKPHNPGLEYDIFAKWNQPRLDANEAAYAAIGQGITRPVNQWNADADGTPPGNPAIAEGWDDWGPFYTQTYGAFFGVDGSTLEMCSNATCGGRFGSKRAQYVGFYASAQFWIDNRAPMLTDQLEVALRNVTNAPRVNCCEAQDLIDRGFDETNHNWMVPYPKAFVIPSHISAGGRPLDFDDGQRSQAESNRLAQWLIANGVQLHRTIKEYVYGGQTIAKHSYVVYMNQFMRGFAYTALSAGQDISDRITQLYAPPGAWSHGQLWGADTIEVPAAATFAPKVEPIAATNPQVGGVRGGGKVDWYALAIRGVAEAQAVLGLLRDGVDGEIAEASFTSASAGAMPAGSVLFEDTPANVTALTAAGLAGGVWFERVLNASKPPTSQLDEAPKIAVLVNSAAPTINDTLFSLRRIFGPDAQFVSTIAGANSLQNAATSPLDGMDVIYNTGQNYPGSVNIAAAPTGATQTGTTATIQTTGNHNLAVGSTVTVAGVGVADYNGTFTVSAVLAANRFSYELGVSGLAASGGGTVTYTGARNRLNGFFANGGGYIGTSVSATNFTFLTNAGLTTGTFTQGSAGAGGGIARWTNSGGAASPVSGAYPATDFWYLPSNVTYFATTPTGAVVDGRYPSGLSASATGPTELFVTGLWRARTSAISVAAVGAPVIVHGDTTAASRYIGVATNPFSRADFERAWPLIATAAMWSNLTDEP